jgi:hypothetical protein
MDICANILVDTAQLKRKKRISVRSEKGEQNNEREIKTMSVLRRNKYPYKRQSHMELHLLL